MKLIKRWKDRREERRKRDLVNHRLTVNSLHSAHNYRIRGTGKYQFDTSLTDKQFIGLKGETYEENWGNAVIDIICYLSGLSYIIAIGQVFPLPLAAGIAFTFKAICSKHPVIRLAFAVFFYAAAYYLFFKGV